MMRTAVVTLLLALAGVFASAPAEAHGRVRVSVGFGFGYPFWGPWGWPPPYYAVPVVVPAPQPVTYIEQRSAPVPDRSAWWYYCDSSKGYYPHVKECPTGWQRVAPEPPQAR